VADSYRRLSERDPSLLRLDLSGSQLIYGGDTDIAYHGNVLGLGKGVFPELKILHLIPASRCERNYLLRVIEGRAYSEWLHHWVLYKKVPTEDSTLGQRLKRLVRLVLADADTRSAECARARGRQRAVSELTTGSK
jgi:hypothetical protein